MTISGLQSSFVSSHSTPSARAALSILSWHFFPRYGPSCHTENSGNIQKVQRSNCAPVIDISPK
jgi:hypothetical protein